MKKIKTKTKFCYGIGNLGYGTVAQAMTSFIMFFGTSVLGIKGTLVGLAVAISAFWDGLSDPIVGYISDRNKSKFLGKRQGYLFIGMIGIIVFNLLLWSVPENFSETVKWIWLLVSLLMLETFNTCFATPYVALGIDMAPDYNDQASLQGFKTVFFILGMVMPSLLMIIFMPSSGADTSQAQLSQSGYIYISYVTSLLCLICGLVCIFGTRKRSSEVTDYEQSKPEKNAFFKIFYNFFVTLKRKNYGSVIICYSVALIAAAFLTSVGMHLFTYSFHFNATQIPIIMTCLFVGAIASQPFWIYLSKRIDKKNSLVCSFLVLLVGIFFTFWVFVFREVLGVVGSFWTIIPFIIVCGFGTGALYSLPISMFADNVTLEKIRTKQNNSATYSGYMTFAFNIANSLALLVIGVLLDLIKFDPKQPVQALKVQNALGYIVFGGCAISIVIAMLVIKNYKLKRSDILKEQMNANKNSQDKN